MAKHKVTAKTPSCCHGGQVFFDALKAMIARMLFLLHSTLTVWRVAEQLGSQFWWLMLASCSLVAETIVVLAKREGREWNWFQPSVFFYLCCAVPSIWILEFQQLKQATGDANTTNDHQSSQVSGFHTALDDREWLQAVEQSLLVLIIITRWLMPKGDLSREQLSSLLLAHLGTASDIVDFYSMLSDEDVMKLPGLSRTILVFWTWSLLQFPFVVTSTRSNIEDENAVEDEENKGVQEEKPMSWSKRMKSKLEHFLKVTLETEAWGIFVSIAVQDGPFVCVRLVAIVKYKIITYTNYFFMAKNALVLTLQLYRIYSLYTEYKNAKEKEKKKMREAWKAIKFYERHRETRGEEDHYRIRQHTFVY